MTNEELAAIEARARNAEPGPWSWEFSGGGGGGEINTDQLSNATWRSWVSNSQVALCSQAYGEEGTAIWEPLIMLGKGSTLRAADAVFLMSCRNDVKVLAAEVNRLRGILDGALVLAREGILTARGQKQAEAYVLIRNYLACLNWQ